MKGNLYVMCMICVGKFILLNWVCVNSPGVKELVFWKKQNKTPTKFWSLKKYGVSRNKLKFLYCILCDNSIKRLAKTVFATADWLSENEREQKLYMKYVKDTTKSCKSYPFCKKHWKLYK